MTYFIFIFCLLAVVCFIFTFIKTVLPYTKAVGIVFTVSLICTVLLGLNYENGFRFLNGDAPTTNFVAQLLIGGDLHLHETFYIYYMNSIYSTIGLLLLSRIVKHYEITKLNKKFPASH